MKISQELKENVLKDIINKLSTKEITNKYNISNASYFRIKKEYTNNEKSQIDSENQETDNEETDIKS